MFASGVVILDAELSVVPSKVKLAWSSSSPSVPARTTLVSVKSETLAVARVASSVTYIVATLATVIFASGIVIAELTVTFPVLSAIVNEVVSSDALIVLVLISPEIVASIELAVTLVA